MGEFIRERREELGMTQREFGAELGYAYGNFIGMLETGQSRFPIDKWQRYAEVLEVPREEFLRRVFEDNEDLRTMLPYLEFKSRGR